MIEIFRDDFIVITREDGGRIVRVRRTSAPASSGIRYTEMCADLMRLVPPPQRAGHGLLVDARDAPMIMDEALESEAARAMQLLGVDFDRVAVLIRTAVGALQAHRLGREHPRELARAELFDDEAAALAYLGGLAPAPASWPPSARRGGSSGR